MAVGNLQDCGHAREFAGVCQFEGCAKRLCPACIEQCSRCGVVLCSDHQVLLDGGTRVFCGDHAGNHVVRKAALHVFDRFIRGR
jgi:hypothetical protein